MGEKRRNVIASEWDLAMVTSSMIWRGTSIAEGAFWVLEQVAAHKERSKSVHKAGE